jgi:hypothetical protein
MAELTVTLAAMIASTEAEARIDAEVVRMRPCMAFGGSNSVFS